MIGSYKNARSWRALGTYIEATKNYTLDSHMTHDGVRILIRGRKDDGSAGSPLFAETISGDRTAEDVADKLMTQLHHHRRQMNFEGAGR